MRRAASLFGAGRSISGMSSHLAPKNRWGSQFWLRNGARSSTNCPHIASPAGPPPIAFNNSFSNRNFPRLEIPATPTKHSPDPKSNRNFRSTNFHSFLGSTGDPALPASSHAPTAHGLSERGLAHAWGSQSWLRNHNPSTGTCAGTAAAQTRSVALRLGRALDPISNRQWKGLESAVTRTKQTTGAVLIDNESASISRHFSRYRAQSPS
jgi:hypothetical protein